MLIPLLASLILCVSSWGPIGHQTVAYIAEQNLTREATLRIADILGPNESLVSVATWADEVRTLPSFKWSEPLHFINTPDWVCNYERARDCTQSVGYCVDAAIQNYSTRVKIYGGNDDLKFLTHFVGDIHQPLHCGFIGDRGGNDIKVKFSDKSTNLHAVWDSGIIEERIKNDFDNDQQKWTEWILKNYQPNDKDCFLCTQEWGDDSIKDACAYSYVHSDGVTRIYSGDYLEQDYYTINIPIIEQLLVTAGYRLSSILNSIL